MANKFRNEMEVDLAGQKILLRPTFENIAAMEANVGSVTYLGWKFSRGVKMVDGKVVVGEAAIKSMPPLSECAQIIFFNQAATKPEDPTLKKYSLEEIWEMVLQTGAPVAREVMKYVAGLTAGNKAVDEATVSEEKKS